MSEATRIDTIRIEDRHRKDFGDIASLAASIKTVGLLQPVVLTSGLRLIAGERRLRAAESLGWETVPTRIVSTLTDAADLLKAEADENTERKAFTPTEAESIAAAIEAALKPLADERKAQAAGKPQGEKVSSPNLGKETKPLRTPRVAASGTGFSAETIRKVRETKKVAEAPTTPEPVRRIAHEALQEMDRTGKVDGAHKHVKRALSAADYITRYPDLEFYSGDPAKVVRLGEAFDGFDDIERRVRIDNLRKSIAAKKRRAAEPEPEPQPDYFAMAEPVFNAANHLGQLINRLDGGEEVIAYAMADADALLSTTWHDQFASLATRLARLADAAKPTIRSVK